MNQKQHLEKFITFLKILFHVHLSNSKSIPLVKLEHIIKGPQNIVGKYNEYPNKNEYSSRWCDSDILDLDKSFDLSMQKLIHLSIIHDDEIITKYWSSSFNAKQTSGLKKWSINAVTTQSIKRLLRNNIT